MYRDILTAVAGLLCVASATGSLYLLCAGVAVRRFATRAQRAAAAAPPVSILKPLCGEDAELYENLDSFCRQEYPAWQVVFGVQDPDDAAIPVVRRLIAAHPKADLALVVEPQRQGGNLKVANLQNMLPRARHDVIVIADSDMRVRPDYLAEVTAPLADQAIGLVTCLYRGVSAGGVWSQLACLNINHGFLPQAVVAAALGERNGCFGATIALRRDTLDAAGGFAAIAESLADDHALGAAVRRLGQRVVLSPHVVDNVVAEPNLAALFRHELRWSRTIRAIAPAGFMGSILTQPMALALLVLGLDVMPLRALAMLALALGCRALMVRMVDRALRLPRTPLWLMPARDLLSFAVFVASFLSRTVAWRDRTFRVGREGQLILDGDRPA
ncbi:MAG TPA: bacteriohopanetetrol glucosamine biosynthesis glycosyltransferase HpnI [Stellaceae bacterium]|nr:bacteriohopanetetrol glucosamine biosynthesis glycosyltransferase HpnI [Stellaceae bacterium]